MAVRATFQRLFESGQIGSMSVKNRIVMPPMLTNLGTGDGFVTQRTKDHYEARAAGGAGLVVVECTSVDYPMSRTGVYELAIDHDRFLPGLAELAAVIKKHGARAAIQLSHAGVSGKAPKGQLPVGPSSPATAGPASFRELTVGEIERLVTCFAEAAVRARDAGFDGVEIQAAHGHLLATFLSPFWNKRQDHYGGKLENRARFLLRTLEAVRGRVGSDYPVWCRINGREFGENGTSLEEAQAVARMTQDAGADAVHVSGAGLPNSAYAFIHRAPMSDPPGLLIPLAEAIKQVVSIPVVAVGRVTPFSGEKVLEEEKADFVAIGRGLLADPELPNKVLSGRVDDVRPCLACNVCADEFIRNNASIQCGVNYAVGKEGKYSIRKADRIKKVLIAGGGPAGLEAARIAALKGHNVILCEKEQHLGGQARLAVIPPHKEKIQELIEYLVLQVRKLGVKVQMRKEVDSDYVKEVTPDAVIVATGAGPYLPDIPGVEKGRVFFAQDVLTEKVRIGDRVIVIGGGRIGAELAEFLADEGKKVTIAARRGEIAGDLGASVRMRLLRRLLEKGVVQFSGVRYEQINSEGVILRTKEGNRAIIEADAIVIAAGTKPITGLFESLKDEGIEVYLAGDCIAPRTIREAIGSGFEVASGL
ncbi:MAG: FAD-dependent oxidoreductase [Chloroflexi bacterium]|nr:FAD-dependent oxidoreductase [Chloroflexota bacterium]